MDFLDIKVLLEELVQCCQSPDISVSEWAERWYGTYVANRDITEKSATMYRQKLKHYILPKIGDVPMREVTEIQLQEILNSSNSSKSTAQKVKIVMQAMFRRAKSCKLILNDPSENIVLPKAPEGTHRSITDLERKEILRLAEEHYAGLYVLTLLQTGIRPGEAIALRWGDINFKERTITISRAVESGTKVKIKGPKTSAGVRVLPISDYLYERLWHRKKNADELIFCQPLTGRMHSSSSANDYWNNFKRALDIQMGAKVYRNKIVQSVVAEDLVAYCLRHARTDIYCLGATLYHLVTGCNPSEPPYEMKPIREINPSLSSGLERIILKCTQRNPEDRYQSAAELMYALDHYKEIDEDYKKKQKRKLAKFIVPTALAVVFAVAGFALSRVAAQQATDTYRDILYEASKTADYGEKVALYGEAIAVPDKAGEKDAYLALIQTYKNNDSRFSVEEANQLTKYIKSNKAALQADPANYTEICFETGKLYWYYYDYGDGTDNQVTRAKSAVEWFQDVLDNAPEGYANLNMARVYVNIGSFYRDITTDITEASDKGKYKPFFDNIRELLDTVATDENESEIVRLELLELSRSALQQYATKFKGDGISQTDMMQMYDQVERTVTGISATADTTEHKKEATVSLLADTKKAIETAYATKGGKQA